MYVVSHEFVQEHSAESPYCGAMVLDDEGYGDTCGLTRAQHAWGRELALVRDRAGAPRPTRLGCSTVSHDRLGQCNSCDPNRTEILGWRLLALTRDPDERTTVC